MPPAAQSFPSCRKRLGRKGALGYVWCILHLTLGNKQTRKKSYRPNTPHRVLLRAARHFGIKYDGSCVLIPAVNPCCKQNWPRSADSHWSVRQRGKDPRKPKRFLRCRPSLRSASQEEEQSARIRSLAAQGFVSEALIPTRVRGKSESPGLQTANQQSVCGLERKKRTQRIRAIASDGSFRRGRF